MTPHDDDIGRQPTRRISSSDPAPDPPSGERPDEGAATDPMVGRMVGTIRLTGVLGGGGMGQVYEGVDEKLGRTVAVKAIRSGQMTDGDARGRFLREAQVLSRLNHPQICQVYDHIEGDDNDYLVLELVEGESLRAAIRRGIPRKRAMVIAEQLAAVLTLTHSRGIIHRDLKPENVMLTPAGDVKVLDFGLAREERSPETDRRPEAPAGLDETLDSTAVESVVETVLGTVVGTIGYMSPEQARGEPASPPSDIYSLGLLLQELFTGRVPYQTGSTAREVLVATAMGVSAPTEGLPRELAQLMDEMKAVEPADRPTAPMVEARLQGIIDAPRRRIRWTVAAAAILIVVGGSAKYAWDLNRERSAAIEARSDAVSAREDAEELMTFMLQDLYDGLVPLGRLDLLEQVSQKTLEYYRPGRLAVSDSVEARRRRGRALRSVGNVFENQGNLDRAIEAYTASQHISSALVTSDPNNLNARAELAFSFLGLGQAETMRGDLQRALTCYENAVSHLQLSLSGRPSESSWARHLTNAYVQQGNLLFTAGQQEEALEVLQLAIETTRDLLDGNPRDLTLRADLADRYRILSQVLASGGDLDAARDASEKDIAICLEVARTDDHNASNIQGLLEGYTWQGRLLMEEDDLPGAVEALQSAVRFGERLIVEDPTNTHWQFRLSASYDTLGEALMVSRKTHAALNAFTRALDLMLPIAALDPSNAYYQNDLAYSHLQVGKTRAALGQTAAAREAWAEAAAVVAPIADADALPAIQETYAQALLLTGRVDEARPVIRRVLDAGWPLDPTTEELCRNHGLIDR